VPTTSSIRRLDAGAATLVFDLRRGYAELATFGPRLPVGEDCEALCDAGRRAPHESEPDVIVPNSVLPLLGSGYAGKSSVELCRAGRELPLRAAPIEWGGDEARSGGTEFRFSLRDEHHRISLASHWRALSSGVIAVESAVNNAADSVLQVARCASLVLPLPRWTRTIVHYDGRWSAEMHESRSALGSAPRIGGGSTGGRPGFTAGQWLRFEAADTCEHHGLCFAVHLEWSGDHEWQVDTDANGDSVLWIGTPLGHGEVELAEGESFVTPRALVAFGSQGRASLRNLWHRHVRDIVLPRQSRAQPRKVHLNTWEACGFEMTLPRLEQLAVDAAALGVERFVLDDGWFSGRRDDRSSLGDWWPSPQVFPQGLAPLIEKIRTLGMDFGLWVEPEMLSPESELYRAHPDWCIHVEGQARPTQRHQLALDLARPEVEAHLLATLDGLLSKHDIAYLKWDHNRELFPSGRRRVARVRALYRLLDELRARHPRVEIETCASGGGRVDLGMLARCARFWASDNNDPIERVRLNRAWWQFLPLGSCGNHVGPDPNPITGRSLPMNYRSKIAMFGHMGIEADPARMSDDERSVLATHVALYKSWRGVLHEGELYEIAHDEPGVAGWLSVSHARALALVVQQEFARYFETTPVRLVGLDRDRRYRVKLLEPWPSPAARYLVDATLWREGVLLSGEALATRGLRLPLRHPATAWLIALEIE
jgi:alpha-galactosidase